MGKFLESLRDGINGINEISPQPETLSPFISFIPSPGADEKQTLEALPADAQAQPDAAENIWLEAIAKAAEVHPPRLLLVQVLWPDDNTQVLSRLVQPGCLVQGLEALSKRFPKAEGVKVCECGSLDEVFTVNSVEVLIL